VVKDAEKNESQQGVHRLNRTVMLAVKRIMEHESETDRRKFLRALRYSIDGDGRTPPKILSPHDIEAETGIAIPEQFDFHIVLDRQRATEFLRTLRYDLKEHALRKKLGQAHWNSTDLFPKRKVALVRNSYVFTYLEILKIEKRTFTPDLDDYLG
jgi:hypothetical protein